MTQESGQEEWALPPLREDIQILPGTPVPEGVPTWNIFDPVRHQYFQIGWTAYQLLLHWREGTSTQLIDKVMGTTTAKVTQQDVLQLIQFLYRHNLTREPPQGGAKSLFEQAMQAKQHWLLKVIHNYLFFRIPLCHPDRFLRRTWRYVAPVFSRKAIIGVAVLGLLGIMGVVRQWESFSTTFLHFFSPQGLVVYVLGLVGIKILHELGHAYTAARYGCRVQTMGIGFLVMVPVLYTDTTDSWKLTSRKQRAAIAGAGTAVELGIAMVATFCWHLCPEGVVKSVLFVLATTSWVMGLLINLNPLLRFDGYYVLSDWLGVPNLQGRAFAFGKWQLRKCLFGWGDDPPEALPMTRQRLLIGYAWATWIYRAILFLGIAVLVYHFFFKVLGIILFIVEIVWFLAMPVYSEIQVWWARRDEVVHSVRGRVMGVVLLGFLVLGWLPVDSTVSLPAVLEARNRTTLFAPVPAKIVKVLVQEGDPVDQGDILVILESVKLARDIEVLQHQMATLDVRFQREAAYQQDREDHLVVGEALRGMEHELEALHGLKNQLTLRAPFAGKVVDLAPSLHPGRWVNTKLAMAYLIDEKREVVQALATEEEQSRLSVGSTGWFYPDDVARAPRSSQLRDLRQVDESQLDVPYLASIYSGQIPVRQNDQGQLRAEHSIYRVELDLEDDESWDQVVRGMIQIKGEPRSLMGELWERVAAVLIRESGF